MEKSAQNEYWNGELGNFNIISIFYFTIHNPVRFYGIENTVLKL